MPSSSVPSRGRADPESGSLQYPIRYGGASLCLVLGTAAVLLSLFLLIKITLKATEDTPKKASVIEPPGPMNARLATARKATSQDLDVLIRSFFSREPPDYDEPHGRKGGDNASLEDDLQVPAVRVTTLSATPETPGCLRNRRC
ncbi:hypothetical protein IscW_ISCW009558 [Ixodes scapularis]|uniref:Uncharacterized protein n=1 Tax=Ixodes scapularis TaxID=6945 RepID=B7Q127_IXOSC|nr:hypothetical protein IscW_ISCW009558 [Ixodes scapularis]|eukprot:XP_002408878.1 hypothetical protein IscW_ISCW009558 [Ixodes scapularis]